MPAEVKRILIVSAFIASGHVPAGCALGPAFHAPGLGTEHVELLAFTATPEVVALTAGELLSAGPPPK